MLIYLGLVQYTLNNQNRPHDANKDGSSDFERFDQKGNSQLNLDIDDELTRSYKIITYSGSSFDPSVIFSEQISNDSRPYEVKHDFSNQVGYVAYGAVPRLHLLFGLMEIMIKYTITTIQMDMASKITASYI